MSPSDEEKDAANYNGDGVEGPTGSSAPVTPHPSPLAPRTQPRSWLWSFIGIALVAIVLLGWLALFIAQQFEKPLTLEQLQKARNVWETKGSKDYEMVYIVRTGSSSRDQFYVVVKDGKVQSALLNGTQQLPPDKLDSRSMTSLFDDIEMFLKIDAKSDAPKAYSRASFAADDGHIVWFARQVSGSQRVDIRVEDFKPTAGK